MNRNDWHDLFGVLVTSINDLTDEVKKLGGVISNQLENIDYELEEMNQYTSDHLNKRKLVAEDEC